MTRVLFMLVTVLLLVRPTVGRGADEAGLEFFEKKIRPLLVTHCYECHAADSKKLGGELRLDDADSIRKGGESGAAINFDKPEASLLLKAIKYDDDALKMPPKGKLPDAAIADLTEWVKRGAPAPAGKPVTKTDTPWEQVFKQRLDWWSLHPVTKPAAPTVNNAAWSQHPIDRFVLAKLEAAGLAPGKAASPRTLARRLSLVLTGLPPSEEQVAEFERNYVAESLRDSDSSAHLSRSNDSQPINAAPSAGRGSDRPTYSRSPATERLVDSLLASPHFGERWARHWLDVVRFSETHGNEWNYEVHHAWRYRDYLIRAFNDDVPYDQFIREHIAGDLLAEPRWNRADNFRESPLGTAFFRFGEVNHDDCISLRSIGYDLVDNQLDTMTKAFQATTVACARCHDHKLDAISTKDYHALLGVLRSSRLVSHTLDGPEVNAEPIARLIELKLKLRTEVARLWLEETPTMREYLVATLAGNGGRPADATLVTTLDPQRLSKWDTVVQDKPFPLEDPFEPWRAMATMPLADEARIATEWQALSTRYATEDRTHTEFNQTAFETFADFRSDKEHGWQTDGHGLRSGSSRSGRLVPSSEGETLLTAILPAGLHTHAASDKLNGAIRSPLLRGGKKRLSFQVAGQRSSAVRLVSNNCQLNYANYRALTSPDFTWVTFSPPEDRDSLRVYAELMTMFDNPKFPDQLSALGGDPANYKLPYEQAAENPRSYFGITRAVWHDGGETPRAELSHMRRLFATNGADVVTGRVSGTALAAGSSLAPSDSTRPAASAMPLKISAPLKVSALKLTPSGSPVEVRSLDDIADRYIASFRSAIKAWPDNTATDDDVTWLNALLKRGLLNNSISMSPRVAELIADYRRTENELVRPRVSPGIGDFGPGCDQPVFARGDCFRPGEPVPRRYLEAFSFANEPFDKNGSGRLQLAEIIASRDNPLTARVMINRVWHHLFGAGLVRTVDDFGHLGDQPSHSELLDELAARFVAEGWSVKKLIRHIVLSQTFQLASEPSAMAREVDPDNRLLQHYSARRLEAEAIRDAILATSGRLDPTPFGPSVQPFRDQSNADRRLFAGPLDGAGRRSVYIKNNLMESPQFLGAFNVPGGKVTTGRRDVTNVPAQALALLNDPFVVQQADVWARRLIERTEPSVAARIDAMFLTALSRPPREEERNRFAQVINQLAELHQVPSDQILPSHAVWKDAAHAMFNLREFIYIP